MVTHTVGRCLPAGAGVAKVLLKRAPWVSLDWDRRQKSRLDAVDSNGNRVDIFLPRGTVMRGGDVLLTQAGVFIVVRAALQPVMEVRPCAVHGHAHDLVRAAYHLGNRHVGVDVQADHLKIEPDHVLAEMLRGMHFDVIACDAPFEPEGGAYQAGGHEHGHGHGHGHEAGHAHTHSNATDPAHAHEPSVASPPKSTP